MRQGALKKAIAAASAYHSNDIEHWCWRVSGPDSVVHVQAHSAVRVSQVRDLSALLLLLSLLFNGRINGTLRNHGDLFPRYFSVALQFLQSESSGTCGIGADIVDTGRHHRNRSLLFTGMGVFTGRFANWDILFSVLALSFCIMGRISISSLCLSSPTYAERRGLIASLCKMQGVLCFAGLRGAIAFALSENMPGPNKDVHATATLSICIFTTIVCGGLTVKILTLTDMKSIDDADVNSDNEESESLSHLHLHLHLHLPSRQMSGRVYAGVKSA